jgi:hypothetical protein
MRALDIWRSWTTALTMKSAAPSRCVVHIGMRKTGSTSIQKSLAGQKARTHVYAKLGPTNHSRALHSMVAEGSGLERIAASIRRARGKTLIISGEGIPRFFAESELRVLKNLLDAHFDRVEIVAYVRDLAGYVTSNFQERVKNGYASFNLLDCAPLYRKWFEKFDLVFGSENVRLWKFDPAGFPQGCVVQDFCARLGLEPPPGVVRKNDSLSREALSLLYIFHRHAGPKMPRKDARSLVRAVQHLSGSPFRLSPKLIAPVLEQCKADTLWMERRLGRSLSDLGTSRPDDVQSEADLLLPGGALEKELESLPHWREPSFAFRAPDQVAQIVDRLKRAQ